MSIESEISSLETRAMHALDIGDRNLFRSCWANEMTFQMSPYGGEIFNVEGLDKFLELADENWNTGPSSLRHCVAAVWVETIDSNTARAQFYCNYFNVGEKMTLAGMGQYEDTVVKSDDGEWRIKHRKLIHLAPLNQ